MSTATLEHSVTLAEQPVGDIVTQNPSAARVLERHGIDYCCQGATSLGMACAAKGAHLGQVVAELEAVPAEAGALDLAGMQLKELAGHIVSVHHGFVRGEIPRLVGLFQKVAAAHGAHDPRISEAQRVFSELAEELTAHMNKEEQILFPWIGTIEAGGNFGPPKQAVAGPIACMMDEHEAAGEALGKLRTLTDDYTPPSHACPTWHALCGALRGFEEDLHRHVHKENSVLFPRALQLAGADASRHGLRAGGCSGR